MVENRKYITTKQLEKKNNDRNMGWRCNAGNQGMGKTMILKAFVYDTTDGKPREITVNQIMCKEGKPYAIFSSDSKMRYEEFKLFAEDNLIHQTSGAQIWLMLNWCNQYDII